VTDVSAAPSAVSAEQRWLFTSDGVRVRAEHLPSSSGEGLALVVVHGFAASLEKPANLRLARVLSQRASVISLELRGHGQSGGVSTFGRDEVAEVDAAVRWARTLGYQRVATIGFSMGAGSTVRHAGLFGDVDATVAISSPAFWDYYGTPNMRLMHLGVLNPVGRVLIRHGMGTRVVKPPWPQPYPLSPSEAAQLIAPIPFLVIHGTEDEFFPEEHARAIHLGAGQGATGRGHLEHLNELWVEEDFGHAEVSISDGLLVRVSEWVERAVAVNNEIGSG
jgi:pimeloyl-ACP methyl ester carboxylesterase